MDAISLLALLFLFFAGVAGQCDNVKVLQEWQGNYQAEFRDNAPKDIDGLRLELSFQSRVLRLELQKGSVEQVDDFTFIITDPALKVSAGEEVWYLIQVYYYFTFPQVVKNVMNDELLCEDNTLTTPEPMVNPCDATGMKPHDYAQVLCMSYVFYEAQRSGPLPADQRVTWRGDSALDDGSDVGHDLSGGYYDAGDHVKFGFPMAFTTTMLGWGLVDFLEGHQEAGQEKYGLAAIKWATDYFLKAHTDTYEFYGQVGSGGPDHAYWGRPEDMTMDRPSYKIDATNGGTELAGETAAALAVASVAFQESDAAYASALLDHAKQLYDFADKYRKNYHDSIPDASAFYRSWNGYGDELCWAALWLAKATGDDQFIEKAKAHWEEFDLTKDSVAQFSWDDKRAGVYALFYNLTSDTQYLDLLNVYLDWLKSGATYTPEGLVHLDAWGANRHAANVAFISLWAAKHGIDGKKNREWARGQIGQLLGDNSRYERSFVVGYGQNPPERPHHRSSSCPFPPSDCHFGLLQPGPNVHTLYGALVGGPSQNGEYEDDRQDYVRNEVACDYNAAFTAALAALVEIS
ncbi:hypothetical protein O3P69_011051 [Scylla paramamosain]|uniref:Endoglucanase n=1 Tax=Scylla paramamosain TaxID=85552 RepID=A0AAW0ST58_SCYPA